MMRLLMGSALAFCAAQAQADGTAWDDIAHDLYGERPLLEGAGLIEIESPYRSENDARTDIAAEIAAPAGKSLAQVWLVIDENPMPVSAAFDLAEPQGRFAFDVTMRINGPTPIHVVAETTDGALYVEDAFVKTSGLGACAAPPGTDPVLALETLGNMEIAFADTAASASLLQMLGEDERARIDISHPSHSGMQMDQISLLFIPMRYVEGVGIALDGRPFAEVTGSISLSENPSLGLSIPGGTRRIDVTMTDTDGTVTYGHAERAGL